MPPARAGADGAVRHKPRLFCVYPVDQPTQCCFVEIHIGDSSEQSFDHQLPRPLVCLRGVVRRSGEADKRTRQLVLQLCKFGGFAADASFSRTAGAACRLLTLKTKHFSIHLEILTSFNQGYFRP